MAKQDLLITTFPAHLSGNVGDHLITQSLLAMLHARQPRYDPVVVFREESLDQYPDDTIRTIVAPGFSVADETYPQLFALYSDIQRLKNFLPIGCSFQGSTPSASAFTDYRYGDATKQFLRSLVRQNGPLMCRDALIVDMLNSNEIDAAYFGDLAMYDEAIVGSKYSGMQDVSSLVFTIQHHDRYSDQSFLLLRLLSERFPAAKCFVSFHSKPNRRSSKIAAFAESLGFTPLFLAGNANNLDVYDGIDFHVGYRLHGHICFLRKRKPSVLLVEDARAFGFSRTPGTDFGCFDALSLETMSADLGAPARAMKFIDSEFNSGFAGYHRVFEFIDDIYGKVVKPYIDAFSKQFLLSEV